MTEDVRECRVRLEEEEEEEEETKRTTTQSLEHNPESTEDCYSPLRVQWTKSSCKATEISKVDKDVQFIFLLLIPCIDSR